jgi:hypothetical protein
MNILFLAAIAPWFGLTVGSAQKDCVSVKMIAPFGPAARAGLRDGQCVSSVDGTSTTQQDKLIEFLSSRTPGRPATIVLSTREELTVIPESRTPRKAREYCEFTRTRSVSVLTLVWKHDDNITQYNLHFDTAVTLGRIRHQLKAAGTARAFINDHCILGHGPTQIDDAPDSAVITGRASIHFGYDKMKDREETITLGPALK